MRYVISTSAADNDYLEAQSYAHSHFGHRVSVRYTYLIDQAFIDLATDPLRAGSFSRFDLSSGVYFYHLKHSKRNVPLSMGRIRTPRHFVVYQTPDSNILLVLRIIHERKNIEQLHFFPMTDR